MNNVNRHNLVRNEQGQARADLTLTGKTDDASQRTGLVACLLLVPSDAEPLVALLKQLAATSQIPTPFPSSSDSAHHIATSAQDRWVEHSKAAKCLGVSKSTLIATHASAESNAARSQDDSNTGNPSLKSSRASKRAQLGLHANLAV